MTKQLGPTFGDEVIAAGLGGKPFAWGATDDSITGRENLDAPDNDTLDDVIAAHDPEKPPPPPPPSQGEQLAFDHENRLRSLEGAPPLSLGDFIVKQRKPNA
jgi:hypothetical protein